MQQLKAAGAAPWFTSACLLCYACSFLLPLEHANLVSVQFSCSAAAAAAVAAAAAAAKAAAAASAAAAAAINRIRESGKQHQEFD